MSCSPAKLASGWSSQVAEERTATGRSAWPHRSESVSYAASSCSTSHCGSGLPVIVARASVATRASAAESSTSSSVTIRSRSASTPVSLSARRYASAVTANPGGTGSPAMVMIPRLVFLPPSTGSRAGS